MGREKPKIVFEDERFAQDLRVILDDEPIATFQTPSFNRLLGDGVKNNITIVAADPGSGKTTCIGQMADELAAQGYKVLFFSQEMAIPFLIQKSISRLSCGRYSLSSLAKQFGEGCESQLREIKDQYLKTIAPNIAYIDEPVSPCDLSIIIRHFIEDTGEKPIVFLDYVQIMPRDESSTTIDERAAVKAAIASFRRIVNKHHVPIFAVSSISRSAYSKNDIGLDVLAESQALEYGADCVLHLATKGSKTEQKTNMKKDERPVVLSVLKNRYGSLQAAEMIFDTRFATFREL